MGGRLAMTQDQFGAVVELLSLEVESAFVLSTTLVPTPKTGDDSYPGDDPSDQVSLLVTSVFPVPQNAYLDRSKWGLSIASPGWVPAFRQAIAAGQVPVFVHTHPGGFANFSTHDNVVDQELAQSARTMGARGYASVVVGGEIADPHVRGRAILFDRTSWGIDADDNSVNAEVRRVTSRDRAVPDFDLATLRTLDAVRVAGRALRLFLPPDNPATTVDQVGSDVATGEAIDGGEPFDRQVRMLGDAGQRNLAAITAAVVGAGGTGSAVAVQLARMGVGHVVLIDDDVVTTPTPTRGHGMRVVDVGRPKVDVLANHLRDIGLGTQVTTVEASVHAPHALAALRPADVIFSCVDGHGARLILNRYAYAHLAVVIDTAVLVSVTDAAAGDGPVVEIDERVTWLGPGAACLLCRGRLDPALAYAENLDVDERRRLAGEGYVAAAQTAQPAVVTLTTMVAALATTEFLLRLTGIGNTQATELLARPHVGDLRRNAVLPRVGCFCTDPTFHGSGLREPYLDLMWSTPPV